MTGVHLRENGVCNIFLDAQDLEYPIEQFIGGRPG
jgi:hypothetical protein